MKTLQETRVALHERTLDIEKLGIRSRERASALTHCQQARMLLGNTLRELGSATPYPQADNPASAVVAPPADVAPVDYDPALPPNPIAAVKEVRRRIEVSVAAVKAVRDEMGGATLALLDGAFVELSLAKNWLGMELARLADSPNAMAGAAVAPFPTA